MASLGVKLTIAQEGKVYIAKFWFWKHIDLDSNSSLAIYYLCNLKVSLDLSFLNEWK